MNNGLPQGWSSIHLEDLVSARKGKKPRAEKDAASKGFVPYLNIRAIEKGEVSSYAEAASSRLGTADDVLVVWDGARSGWPGLGREGALGSTIMALQPKAGDRTYLYRWLQTQFEHVNSNTRGTGIPHVDPEVFWKLEVPFAPLNEQRRIVAKLEKLLGKVDTCQQRMEKVPPLLKRFRQSVLAAACSGRLTADWREENSQVESAVMLLDRIRKERQFLIGTGLIKKTKFDNLQRASDGESELPSKWVWCRFNEITQLITDGKHGDCEDQENSGYFFLSAKDIQNGKLIYDEARQIRRSDFIEVHKRTNLQRGDICLVNTGATVGKLAIAPEADRTARTTFQKSVAVIKPLKKLVNTEYIARFLNSRNQALLKQSGGSAVNNLLISAIKELLIPLPPLAEQHEIVRRVEGLFALADQIEARYAKAKAHVEKLTQSILAKAFRGELVPQDPKDEPASVLLERIRKQNGHASRGSRSKS